MTETREYRPECLPRRGEINAWVLAFGFAVVLLIANSIWSGMLGLVWAFEAVLLFSAAAISLGNWMDRRTVLRTGPDGISFENGLRSVRMTWTDVEEVAVARTNVGERIQVAGGRAHFMFKSLGGMKFFGQSMQTGFAAGSEILDTILQSTGLKLEKELQGVSYYARN